MVAVTSSMIDDVAYDPDRRRLTVRFKKGAVHHYDDVPPEEFDAILSAPSAGQHFLLNVKGQYKSQRG